VSAIRPREVVTAIATMIALVVLWEAAVWAFKIPTFLVPAPSEIWQEFLSKTALYTNHTAITLWETVLGFLLAVVFGFVAAVAIVYSPLLQAIVYPIILVLQIVPKVAVAPLLLIYLGYGQPSKMTIALLLAFFPIVVNTATGLKAVDQELVDLVKVLRGNRWQEFLKIRFPASVPYIFSGLKIAITLAVIGAIIGEFVGGNEGLGFLIVMANAQLVTPMSFASLTLLSIIGVALFGIIVLLERLIAPWALTEEEEIPITM
jgi:NitT/TauT family transport system permease protein